MAEFLRRAGRFELLRPIGRGAMAVVYLANDPVLRRYVAVKELLVFEDMDPVLGERFVRESQVIASLVHKNIVSIYDSFTEDSIPCIAMEYLPRGPLTRYLKGLSFAQVVGVLEGVLGALAAAEQSWIVHRDVKPANILVTSTGEVKLSDFGIAKAANTATLTATHAVLGTPAYMAPEQSTNGEIGPWTDVYATGVVAFQLLTGRLPFSGASVESLMRAHIEAPIPPMPADWDPRLRDWLLKTLTKSAADRFQRADQAWNELEEIAIDLLGPRWRRSAGLVGPRDAAKDDELTHPSLRRSTNLADPAAAGESSRDDNLGNPGVPSESDLSHSNDAEYLEFMGPVDTAQRIREAAAGPGSRAGGANEEGLSPSDIGDSRPQDPAGGHVSAPHATTILPGVDPRSPGGNRDSPEEKRLDGRRARKGARRGFLLLGMLFLVGGVGAFFALQGGQPSKSTRSRSPTQPSRLAQAKVLGPPLDAKGVGEFVVDAGAGWVVRTSHPVVSRIDLKSRAERDVRVGGTPQQVTATHGAVFVDNPPNVQRVDERTLAVSHEFVGRSHGSIGYAPTPLMLWRVAGREINGLDPDDLQHTVGLTLGYTPTDYDATPSHLAILTPKGQLELRDPDTARLDIGPIAFHQKLFVIVSVGDVFCVLGDSKAFSVDSQSGVRLGSFDIPSTWSYAAASRRALWLSDSAAGVVKLFDPRHGRLIGQPVHAPGAGSLAVDDQGEALVRIRGKRLLPVQGV